MNEYTLLTAVFLTAIVLLGILKILNIDEKLRHKKVDKQEKIFLFGFLLIYILFNLTCAYFANEHYGILWLIAAVWPVIALFAIYVAKKGF